MSEWVIIWAATMTATTGILGVALTIYARRAHSIELQRREALFEIWRHLWGLTGDNQHPLYAQANMRAVEALNAAFVVFNETDAEDALKTYRRHPTAENAEYAISKMAEVCEIRLDEDDIQPFAPADSS